MWRLAYLYMILFGGSWFVVLPALLLKISGQFPPRIRSLPSLLIGICLFLCGLALSWIAAHHLVVFGQGTPFPLDPTKRLVDSGPYTYVRNPQGIATVLMVL